MFALTSFTQHFTEFQIRTRSLKLQGKRIKQRYKIGNKAMQLPLFTDYKTILS
jgi:hypothetical protein